MSAADRKPFDPQTAGESTPRPLGLAATRATCAGCMARDITDHLCPLSGFVLPLSQC